jgi:ribosome-binding factor A
MIKMKAGKSSKSVAEQLGLGRPKRRPARVAQAIQQELALLFLRDVKDPLVQQVTITTVEVTPDLRRAIILYDSPEKEAARAAAGLERVKGYARSHLAQALQLRCVPELVFKRDAGPAIQARIENLLRADQEQDEPPTE